MKTKPSVSLLLFSVAALAFVGMLSFSEYKAICTVVVWACAGTILALKLVQSDKPKQTDKRTPEEIKTHKEVRNKVILWPLAFAFGSAVTILIRMFVN